MRLFGFLKSHQIGIITSTVENEASRTLSWAVTQRLSSGLSNEIRSAVLDLCWDRLHDLRTYLTMVSVANRSRLAQRLGDIVTMFGKLLGEARRISRSPRDQVRPRLQTVPPYLRNLALDIYTGQLLSDKTQLRRLLKKSASLEDQTILGSNMPMGVVLQEGSYKDVPCFNRFPFFAYVK